MITARCALPPEAVKFFGLDRDPFDAARVPSEAELFTSAALDQVAASIRAAAMNHGLLAVIGPVGSGKTSLKLRVVRELRAARSNGYEVRLLHPEFFDMADVKVGAVARYLLEEFETRCPPDSVARVRKIRRLLVRLRAEAVRVALVFDECHRLNDKVLASLKNFWEMTGENDERLLGIILFGQPKFAESTLRDYKFREIAERIQLVKMPELEKNAREYLAHRLARAGGRLETLFEERAVERLIRAAQTPLALGNLANEALLEAYQLRDKCVFASTLNLPEPASIRRFRKSD